MARALIAALIAALPLAAGAGPESWRAIRSTGGVQVGAPFPSADGWLLRVRARLSKLRTAPPPQAPEGGPSCVRTQAVVEGDAIYLTIISGAPRGPAAAICPAAKLGEVAPGTYRVFYRGPDEAAVLLQDVELRR